MSSYSSTRSEFQNTKEDLEHWFKNNRHWICKNQNSEKPIFWTNVLRHLRINSLAACPGVTPHLRCLAGVGRQGRAMLSMCQLFWCFGASATTHPARTFYQEWWRGSFKYLQQLLTALTRSSRIRVPHLFSSMSECLMSASGPLGLLEGLGD